MKKIEVKELADLGPQFTNNKHGIIGMDGAFSVPLGDGRTFWYFGDTLFGKRVPDESLWYPGGEKIGPGQMHGVGGVENMRTNTALIIEDNKVNRELDPFEFVLNGNGKPLQPVPHLENEDPDEIRVWCQDGVCIGELIYLSYVNVRMLADGPMPVNFELLGTGLAVGKKDEYQFRRLEHEGETLWWKVPMPGFGGGITHDEETDFVYFYGNARDDKSGMQQCFVARVTAEKIEDFSAYEYYKGKNQWSDSPNDAVMITNGIPNELTVSWNEHLGAWLMVHSLDLTGKIVGRTAPDPWGPWSEPTCLFQAFRPPLDYEVSYFPLIYAGKNHVELEKEHGRILYLTYVEFEEYYPHLIEVVLE